MVIKMESQEPEAIIPMEIVSSGGPTMLRSAVTTNEEPEAIIPMEVVSSGSSTMLRSAATTRLRRKVARRTESWYLASPPPQDDEDIPARKKPRLEEPLPTTTDEVARKTASPDVSAGLLPPAADNDDEDEANADPVTDTQPNAGATPVTRRRWTVKEDAKLTSAATNTSKKKWGKEYRIDWGAITALVPGRTIIQCSSRWHDALNPSIDRANDRTGKWSEDEDIKLKDAVATHSGRNGR
jgi:hypothetical protein